MDIKNTLKNLGDNLVKAKDLGYKLSKEKAAATTFPRSGTGMHGPSSFGVNANTQPATARMAGGVGLQKVAATLIHTGINKFIMPEVDKQMKNLATKIKSDLTSKKHLSNGGKFARKPSVSM